MCDFYKIIIVAAADILLLLFLPFQPKILKYKRKKKKMKCHNAHTIAEVSQDIDVKCNDWLTDGLASWALSM